MNEVASLARQIERTPDANLSPADLQRKQYLSDLLGEEMKNQDFGQGRELPQGLARRLISDGPVGSPQDMVNEQYPVTTSNGKEIKVVGKDGKERRIFVRHKPGKVWDQDVVAADGGAFTDERGNYIEPPLGVKRPDGTVQNIRIDRQGNLTDNVVPAFKQIRFGLPPKPDERFFFNTDQQPGSFGQAARNAASLLRERINDPADSLTADTVITPEIARDLELLYGEKAQRQPGDNSFPRETVYSPDGPKQVIRQILSGDKAVAAPAVEGGRSQQTVGQLLRSLEGNFEGRILRDNDKAQAAIVRENADRRGRGQYTEAELREMARKEANRQIVGPVKGEFGYGAWPTRSVAGLGAVDLDSSPSKSIRQQRLRNLEAEIDGIDISTSDGQVKQQALIREYRELAIQGKQARQARVVNGQPVGVNENFDQDFWNDVELRRGSVTSSDVAGRAGRDGQIMIDIQDAIAEGRSGAPSWSTVADAQNRVGGNVDLAGADINAIERQQRILDSLRRNADSVEAYVGQVRPLIEADNIAAAEAWPERRAQAAIARERAKPGRRGVVLGREEADIRAAYAPELSDQMIAEAMNRGWDIGDELVIDSNGFESGHIKRRDGFEAKLNFKNNVQLGTAIPMSGGGWQDASNREVIAPTRENEWRQPFDMQGRPIAEDAIAGQQVRWEEPRLDPKKSRGLAWVQNNLFSEWDNRKMGDAASGDWDPVSIQSSLNRFNDEASNKLRKSVEGIAGMSPEAAIAREGQQRKPELLGIWRDREPIPMNSPAQSALVRKPVVPTQVSVRNVSDFQNVMDQIIDSKQFFDVKDLPEGIPFKEQKGGNKRVRKSDLPEEMLFDVAMQDMKMAPKDRTNLAKALQLIDQAPMMDDNQLRMNNEGIPREQQFLGQRIDAQPKNPMEQYLHLLRDDHPLIVGDKQSNAAGSQFLGVRRFDRDVTLNRIAGVKMDVPKVNDDGAPVLNRWGEPIMVQKEVNPMLRQLDVNVEVDRVADALIQQEEARLRSVNPSFSGLDSRTKGALRSIAFEQVAGPDPDKWIGEAQNGFIAATGNVDPVKMEDGQVVIDQESRRRQILAGNQRLDRGGQKRKRPQDRQDVVVVNINDTPSQVEQKAGFFADSGKPNLFGAAQAPMQLELREQELQRQRWPDSAYVGNYPEGDALRAVEAANAPIAARAARRQPLKPEDLIRKERSNNEFNLADGRGLRNRQLGGGQAQGGVNNQPPVAMLPPVKGQRGLFDSNGQPLGIDIIPGRHYASSQAATSQQLSGTGNSSAPIELSDQTIRRPAPAPAKAIGSEVAKRSGSTFFTEDVWADTSSTRQDPDRMFGQKYDGPFDRARPSMSTDPEVAARRSFTDPIWEERRQEFNANRRTPESSARAPKSGQPANDFFSRAGRHIKKRRGLYGAGAGATAAVGLGSLIGGERDRREEEQRMY